MSMRICTRVAAIAAASGLSATFAAAAVTIPTVPIANPGNALDPMSGQGSVAYIYAIGATEVTNAQYTAFLNAVAATDTNSLYNTNMAGSFGGIARSGSAGSYTYTTISGRANHPVNFVSFWDAARFANWLHNGQPMGAQNNSTTEDGAYTLTAGGIAANTVSRNAGWQWAIANSQEWYKAAYHQPAAQGGDTDSYWLYPTASNTAPTAGQANFLPSGIANTTAVASYAPNFYGTYDMAGNVYEWSETSPVPGGPFRGPMLGGAFDNIDGWLTHLNPIIQLPATEREQVGFRVVAVPAPSAIALVGMGTLIASRRRRA